MRFSRECYMGGLNYFSNQYFCKRKTSSGWISSVGQRYAAPMWKCNMALSHTNTLHNHGRAHCCCVGGTCPWCILAAYRIRFLQMSSVSTSLQRYDGYAFLWRWYRATSLCCSNRLQYIAEIRLSLCFAAMWYNVCQELTTLAHNCSMWVLCSFIAGWTLRSMSFIFVFKELPAAPSFGRYYMGRNLTEHNSAF